MQSGFIDEVEAYYKAKKQYMETIHTPKAENKSQQESEDGPNPLPKIEKSRRAFFCSDPEALKIDIARINNLIKFIESQPEQSTQEGKPKEKE